MAAYTTTYKLTPEQEKKVLDYFLECVAYSSNRFNMRPQLERLDRLYMREVDNSIEQWKAKAANRRGDPTKYQNIVVPVVMPQVENAVAFQNNVFLQGQPIFAAVTSPEYSDIALQMDSVIEDQQIRGGWVNEFQKVFRCGFKYNLSATLCDWHTEVAFAGTGDREASLDGSGDPIEDPSSSEVIWAGNRIRALDLYNTFFDPTPDPNRVHSEGEYAGYSIQRSRMGLFRYLRDLPGAFNTSKAMEAPSKGTTHYQYYLPLLHKDVLIQPDSLLSNVWAGLGMPKAGASEQTAEGIRRRLTGNSFTITNFYAWIIPKELGITQVDSNKTPQIWKFVVVNGSVIVQAERQTNSHGYLPIIVNQAYDDLLGYQTKSLALNVGAVQEITSATANSIIAGKRRAIADRLVYDASRVNLADLADDSPTSRIGIRPSAFNSDISSAVVPLPFTDSTISDSRQDIQLFLGMADVVTGMNPARQGQFVKGNKTREEFNTIMQNSEGRDMTVAMSLESSLFTPIKTIIKANILQFQTNATLFSSTESRVVEVDPEALSKAMISFKLADGLMPTDKLMNSETMAVAFQTIQSVPEIAAGYDSVGLFSYLMKSQGANLRPFEKPAERLAYEQAVAQWQQTMLAMAQQLQAQLEELDPEQLQELMQQMPPQPKPEDFGWNPSQEFKPEPEGSLLEQFIGAIQQTREELVEEEAQGIQGQPAQGLMG